jgi:predicted esterase
VDDPDGLVLVGWSMGGVAAAGLTIQAQRLGVAFAHTVCLAGAFMVADPISGSVPATQLDGVGAGSPFTLLSGVSDHVIRVAVAHDFASALRHNDWPVEVVELPADHGSIAGAVYDAAAGRYSAATDAKTLAVAADVAAHIAAASRSSR